MRWPSPPLAARHRRCLNIAVDCIYDIFEIIAGDSPVWRRAVSGREAVRARLKDIAAKTTNEVQVMHAPSLSLIAIMNEPKIPKDEWTKVEPTQQTWSGVNSPY